MSSDLVKRLPDKVRNHTQFIYERASGINLSLWSEMANDFLSAADRIEALEGEVAMLREENRGLAAQCSGDRGKLDKAEARAERLRVAALEALNNLHDRLDSNCKCRDCKHTHPTAVSTLSKALEDDKQ